MFIKCVNCDSCVNSRKFEGTVNNFMETATATDTTKNFYFANCVEVFVNTKRSIQANCLYRCTLVILLFRAIHHL